MPTECFPQRAKTASQWLSQKGLAAAGCAALADFLLFERDIGLSLALFLAALGLVIPVVNVVRARGRLRIIAEGALFAGLLALLVDVSLLSILFALAGLLAYALILSTGRIGGLPEFLRRILQTPFIGPFRLVDDWRRARRASRRKPAAPRRRLALVAWIAPLGFGALFVVLFAAANPLIENLLTSIDLRLLFSVFDIKRALFWALVICAIWPLLHLRARRLNAKPTVAKGPANSVLDNCGELFGETAILRSLLLFNALFALQTAMDLIYLWGGASLPNGMSHASYAHRGAYPLVLTALLAAGFVLAAMRRGGPAETSRLIQPLVLAWIAQNVMLVLSSILRLNLYVAAYSLTYLRVAAFIWMGLVAVGLLLIVVQIARRKSNGWLLAMNAGALVLALYACCFVNFPDVIGRYNLGRQREVAQSGHMLDMEYLWSLGPMAIPAFDAWLEQGDASAAYVVSTVLRERRRLADEFLVQPDEWRAFSIRRWRLRQYLASKTGAAKASADSAQRL